MIKDSLQKIPCWLWLLWFIVWLNALFFFSGVGGNDGWGYYANLETMVDDFDLNVDNNLKAYQDGRPLGVALNPDQSESTYKTGYGFGFSLCYVIPFWAGGQVADLWGGTIDTSKMAESSPYHGQETRTMIRIIFCVIWSEILTLVLVALMFWMARQFGADNKMAFAVTLLCWLGSPLPYYANNMMSHVASSLLLAIAFIPVIRKWGSFYVMGLLSGLATLPREPNMMVGVAIGWDAFSRGKVKGFISYSLGYLTVFSFNLIQWTVRNGSPFKIGVESEPTLDWSHPPIYNMLVDPRFGYFWWFPAMAFAFWKMIPLCRKHKEHRPAMILVALLVVSYSFHHETATSGWGQRYLSPFALLLLSGGSRSVS